MFQLPDIDDTLFLFAYFTVGGYGALCLCFDKSSLSSLLLLCLGLLRLLCVLLVFFKNLNVVFVIGEHDFNSGFIKTFYIVWQHVWQHVLVP